jgi:hypothetical protein
MLTRYRISTLALLTLGVAGPLAAGHPAYAQDDDDEAPFEQRLLRGLLGGNSGPAIDYRERSPLVIPPARELPPPDTAANAERSPAWPNDPDAKRAKQAAAKSRGPEIDAYRESGRNLRPDELRTGAVRGAGRSSEPARTLSDNEMSRPLRPSEMGDNKSVFGLFGKVTENEPTQTFAGEPTRTRLTEPPTGYRTPSAAQPYTPPKDSGTSWFKLPDVFDRGLSKDR